ncbi:MAG: ABC transporter permease [Rhodospirillales bacterium 20-64-7]|nr:MAG: ABC transporter permease [Rhodospirillales bacterium 20-64-7]
MSNAVLRQDGDVLAFSGDLVAKNVGGIWKSSIAAAKRAQADVLSVDISACPMIDTAGATLLLTMEQAHGGEMQLQGAETQGVALIAQLRKIIPPPLTSQEDQRAAREAVHESRAPTALENLKIRIAFFGETIVALMVLPAKLRFLRGSDFAHIADNAGLKALPLVVMLGFLIGMILAFQSAIPMQQFGADLYVADLVALSLFRELGPLLVSVILAGRTGSAFAAELGTMQVNEEIAALTTMGIDPETMLVLPRVAAAVLVMPALVVAMDVSGLIGMGVVLMAFGFPASAIIGQITFAAGPSDFLLGLCKAMVFAAAVAMIGCRSGLTAGNGPRAVGEAATSAVVGGIVATVLLDGLFAVLFYRLGL